MSSICSGRRRDWMRSIVSALRSRGRLLRCAPPRAAPTSGPPRGEWRCFTRSSGGARTCSPPAGRARRLPDGRGGRHAAPTSGGRECVANRGSSVPPVRAGGSSRYRPMRSGAIWKADRRSGSTRCGRTRPAGWLRSISTVPRGERMPSFCVRARRISGSPCWLNGLAQGTARTCGSCSPRLSRRASRGHLARSCSPVRCLVGRSG